MKDIDRSSDHNCKNCSYGYYNGNTPYCVKDRTPILNPNIGCSSWKQGSIKGRRKRS